LNVLYRQSNSLRKIPYFVCLLNRFVTNIFNNLINKFIRKNGFNLILNFYRVVIKNLQLFVDQYRVICKNVFYCKILISIHKFIILMYISLKLLIGKISLNILFTCNCNTSKSKTKISNFWCFPTYFGIIIIRKQN